MNPIIKMDKDFKDKIAIIFIILIIIVLLSSFVVLPLILYKRKKVQTESNYSPVEYTNYPNLTGNPVADIAILNQAGFRYDY